MGLQLAYFVLYIDCLLWQETQLASQACLEQNWHASFQHCTGASFQMQLQMQEFVARGAPTFEVSPGMWGGVLDSPPAAPWGVQSSGSD